MTQPQFRAVLAAVLVVIVIGVGIVAWSMTHQPSSRVCSRWDTMYGGHQVTYPC